MDSNSNQNTNDDSRQLRTLLKRAGYTSFRMGPKSRGMYLLGRTREWNIVGRLGNNWLNLYTVVCELPTASGVRARLLEATMSANQRMSLTKFITSDRQLILELDYRIEHVDEEVCRNLVSLMFSNAEENYPALFRIVTGDDVLKQLGDDLGLILPDAA